MHRIRRPISGPAIAWDVVMNAILQLSPNARLLDRESFRNAHSTSNPDGSFDAAFAFRQLVDPIPEFERYLVSGGGSTESVYGAILAGATTSSPTVQALLAEAKQSFAAAALPSVGDTPGEWRPVDAEPATWFRITPNQLRSVTFLPDESPFPGYTTIGAASAGFGLQTEAGAPVPGGQDAVRRITMHYLEVRLVRPWLDPTFFGMAGWSLSGQPAGAVSTGSTTDNAGLLALIPQSIFVGFSATVELQRPIVELTADVPGRSLAVGPIPVRSPAASASAATPLVSRQGLFLLGAASSLTPLAPATASP